MTGAAPRRILIIKLGALGDFVLATGPMGAIREANPDAHITLLTTAPYVALAESCPWINAVWCDDRPRWWQVSGWLALRRRLRGGRFDMVYDLQTSDRSGFYFRLMGPDRPDWSGIASGCSYPDKNAGRDTLHTIERQMGQLAYAGIAYVPPPDLSWVEADISRFGLAARFVLIAPGASAHRDAKRWPVERFAELAPVLAQKGAQPVIIGGPGEKALGAAIAAACSEARDLTGETSLAELCVLARAAAGAVGNDSGPMHIAAICGAPTVVLFSSASDPALCAPRGPSVTVLRRENLADLPARDVAAALSLR